MAAGMAKIRFFPCGSIDIRPSPNAHHLKGGVGAFALIFFDKTGMTPLPSVAGANLFRDAQLRLLDLGHANKSAP